MKKPAFLVSALCCLALVAAVPATLITAGEKASFTAENVTPTAEEIKLYTLIMRYRAGRGLASIPFSPSLTHVAQTHARDLTENKPAEGKCNMHSWSSKGPWTACCYTGDHARASCMWDKPRELTNYPGNGYEISHGMWGAVITAEGALRGWQGSPGHNAVILNEGMWSRTPWKAVGIGIYGNYAVVWFGNEEDPAGSIRP